MNNPIGGAFGDALSQIKTGDLMAATAAIQIALGRSDVLSSAGLAGVSTNRHASSPRSDGLGNVLQRLKSFKDAPRPFDAPQDTISDPLLDADDGRFPARRYSGADGQLTYKIYVPENRDRELALVIMLHGCTQNPDDFARGTRMNQLADEYGLIIAYPHQPRSANAQGCWNWFDPRHQKRGTGEPAMLAGLAQELAAEYGIAAKRTFAAGLSAGGAMADILASTYPDVFAAVGIHSGLPHGSANDVMSAFAAMKGNRTSHQNHVVTHSDDRARRIIFHGSSDATVHASNSDAILGRAQQSNIHCVSTSIDSSSNGRKISRTLVDTATGEPAAEYWLVHGAGHAWSGGDRAGTYTDTAGPDASREMIRFFLA